MNDVDGPGARLTAASPEKGRTGPADGPKAGAAMRSTAEQGEFAMQPVPWRLKNR